MMSDDEIIAVVRAHREGKKIEGRPIRVRIEYDWMELTIPKWNFESVEYRVAPEPCKPREWMINVLPDGRINTGALIANHVTQDDHCNLVKVREVIE